MEKTPADLSNNVYRTTRRITGNDDPYRAEKKIYNDLCMAMLPGIRTRIEMSADQRRAAVSAAVFGNIIDLGIGHEFDLEADLESVFGCTFAVDDYERFREEVGSGRKKILYLCDNAGEIVFDRLLVEMLAENHEITCTVKSGPVINDATMEDAVSTGLTEIARVIETGSDGIGVEWSAVSDEFIRYFESADIIVSKGQGNFETMSACGKYIYFLLKAKCHGVAEMLGVEFGDIVFRRSSGAS